MLLLTGDLGFFEAVLGHKKVETTDVHGTTTPVGHPDQISEPYLWGPGGLLQLGLLKSPNFVKVQLSLIKKQKGLKIHNSAYTY